MVQPTDDYEDLARSLMNQEPEGLRRFAAMFGPCLRGYFIRRGLGVTEAEDLACDCITDFALNVPEHYRPGRPGSFQRWVFVSARNALVDRIRQRPASVTNFPDAVLESVDCPDVEADLQALDALDEALLDLSEVERKIVQLRDLDVPRDYAEIGRLLGLPTATARVYHHRALRRLREKLREDPRMQPFLERNRSRDEYHA